MADAIAMHPGEFRQDLLTPSASGAQGPDTAAGITGKGHGIKGFLSGSHLPCACPPMTDRARAFPDHPGYSGFLVLADLAPRFLSGFVAALMHESVLEVCDVGITSLFPSRGEDRGSSPPGSAIISTGYMPPGDFSAPGQGDRAAGGLPALACWPLRHMPCLSPWPDTCAGQPGPAMPANPRKGGCRHAEAPQSRR